MIEKFKGEETRPSGVVYDGSLNQVKRIHAIDPILAGELAITILELTLDGTISSNNDMVIACVENLERTVRKDREKYEKRLDSFGNQNKIMKKNREIRLNQIAELYRQGLTQKQIAEKLGKAESTISKDMTLIRNEYPQWLEEQTENENEPLTLEEQIEKLK